MSPPEPLENPLGLPADSPGLSFRAFRSDQDGMGVLWAINRLIFHPMGYALAIHCDDNGSPTGWSMLGNGQEPWNFSGSLDDHGFEAFQLLKDTLAGRTPLGACCSCYGVYEDCVICEHCLERLCHECAREHAELQVMT